MVIGFGRSQMKKDSRGLRVVMMVVGSVVGLSLLFLVAAIIPSKVTIEEAKYYPTYFSNLAEKQSLNASFKSKYKNLERIDVLFKNPNLESRDELIIRLIGENNNLITQKSFSGFNLGDTSHARIDLTKGSVAVGEKVSVEVVLTKVVDGKLMIGTKNDSINLIQYYDSNDLGAILSRFTNIWSKVFKKPLVILLPLVVGVVAIW